jgi:hypothetical protein
MNCTPYDYCALQNKTWIEGESAKLIQATPTPVITCLLVERLGVGGGGGDVSVTGSLVGAGGELEVLGSSEVGVAGRLVGSSVVSGKIEFSFEASKHCCGLWVNTTFDVEAAIFK